MKRNLTQRWTILGLMLGLSLLVGLGGCSTAERVLAEHYSSIHLSVFHNQTFQYAIEEQLAHSMIETFQRDGRLTVSRLPNADLQMTGEIADVEVRPVAYTDLDRAVGYSMDITVHVTVVDTSSGEVLMEKHPFSASGIYMLSNTPSGARTQDVTRLLSESVLSYLVEGW